MGNDDFFKDPEQQAEKQVEQNIEEHIVPEPVEAPVAEVPKRSFFQRLKPELPKRLVGQPQRVAGPVPGRGARFRSFILECKRVLRVTKKPDKQEFYTIVKVSALGMAVIGVIGFLISLLKELFF